MKITYKYVNELVPYPFNPRFNDGGVDAVANSIKEFGFRNPIQIDKNNTVVAGHTRLKAAKQLGLKVVPCIYIEDLTDDEIKAYRIADNSTSEFATWNNELLQNELASLKMDDSIKDSMSILSDTTTPNRPNFDDIEVHANDEGDNVVLQLEHEPIIYKNALIPLRWARYKVMISKDDLLRFETVYDNYVAKNGSDEGFVSMLLNGESVQYE